MRDSAKTYMQVKRSEYVRECRTGVQQRRREWKKTKQKRENRKAMPQTQPPREQEEEGSRSRLTQVWWLENEISAVHHHLKKAHSALQEEMRVMGNVKTHSLRCCQRMKNR